MSLVKTNFRFDGLASGPVVTLAHAVGTKLDVWDTQIEALAAAGFCVLRYDVRGHGASDVPPGPYTLDEMARDLRELLDDLGIARTHFVGLSMGALIGIAAALQYPERIASLVLCGSTACYGSELELRGSWDKRIRIAESEGMSAALVEEMIETWFTPRPETQNAALNRVRVMLSEANPTGYIASIRAIATTDLRERLDAIRCPTLVIAGGHDRQTPPSMAQEIHERILGSRLLVFPSSGHCVALETPSGVSPALVEFLTEQSFPECEEITDNRPVRQGDIFRWSESGDGPYNLLGIVVTADCDIDKKKHRGILSYVPILPINDYLRLFYLPAALSRALIPIREQLIKLIREQQQRNREDFPEAVSQDAALVWAGSRRAEEIATELRLPEGRPRSILVELATDYQMAVRALESEAFQDQVNSLLRLRSRREASMTREKLFEDMYSRLGTSPPDDCLFIGRIGLDYRTGYIAYLRLVREIQEEDVAIRQEPDPGYRAGHRPRARRIARLRSPYVYRLTQQLVQVFASIGLPAEYERRRDQLLELHASGLLLDPKGGVEKA